LNISVVIPALNESANIGRCLDSLEAQTRRADEIIVVDNGSEDDTVEIALAYDAKVLSYPSPEYRHGNIGLVRQRGVEEAVGDIIVSMDADATFPPDHLEKIENYFVANPRLVMLGGPVYQRVRHWFWDWYTGTGNFVRSYLAGWGVPFFYGSNTSFRKNAFMKTEGYKGAGAHGPVEEWIIAFRLNRVGEWMWCEDVYCYI